MIRCAAGIVALFCCLSCPARAAVTVILVRHAEVVGAGSNPRISAQGQQRAELLASMLKDVALDTIYVTEYARTQETAKPTAARHHLAPRQFKAADTADLLREIRKHSSGSILVVGHSNTLPRIISGLGGPAVQIGELQFDNLFLVTLTASEAVLVPLHYGASPLAVPGERSISSERSKVVRIKFSRSGGFAGMARPVVSGNVDLTNGAVASSAGGYQRTLAADEAAEVQAGADPADLLRAKEQIDANRNRSRGGAADMDDYSIGVTTQDGKTHEDIHLHLPLTSSDLENVSPATRKFLAWIQSEVRNIQSHNRSQQ